MAEKFELFSTTPVSIIFVQHAYYRLKVKKQAIDTDVIPKLLKLVDIKFSFDYW